MILRHLYLIHKTSPYPSPFSICFFFYYIINFFSILYTKPSNKY
nr:MAG TPA: hypothetical protein [Caudoviricetes sp.]